jgi:hypothetical protein
MTRALPPDDLPVKADPLVKPDLLVKVDPALNAGSPFTDDAGDDPQLPRQLHPLPRGLVELYGFLAVLFVLVPEWMAGGALFGFRDGRLGSDLPAPSGAWRRLPELRLASMTTAQLRLLAHEQRLPGYGRLSREQLTAKLLKRLKRLA